MSIDSFREYLQALQADDAIVRIDDPVSWNLQASAITMRANETDSRIPLFETVDDTGIDNARLVGDPYRGSQDRPWDHIARALDLPVDLSGTEYYETIVERLQSPVEPNRADPNEAPCKEIVRTGNDIDLLEFPWPYIHAGDGGRYSNLHTVIAPDPDSGWTDWSDHRTMIHDSTRASMLFLAGEQTPNLYYYKYERRDEPMPIAVVIGAEPAVQCTSVMWIPTGRNEADFAGGLKREPVDLVECETNDLLVPATAEIILEGHVVPNARRDEGPFGEYFGYMHGPRRSMPVFEIEAITHRRDPLVPFCVEGSGVGYSENTTSAMEIGCVGPDATLGLRTAGFDIEKCVPWRTTPRTAYVVGTDTPRPGYLHDLANFIFTTWGMLHVDFFIFVDADVDPLNQRAVIEALALHADPDEDFHQFGVETMPKVPLNIYQTPSEKGDAQTGTSKTKTAKAYIDATRGDDTAARGSTIEHRREAQKTLAAAGMDGTNLLFLDPGDER